MRVAYHPIRETRRRELVETREEPEAHPSETTAFQAIDSEMFLPMLSP